MIDYDGCHYVTTRYRPVTTGETGDSRTVDGTRVSRMAPACAFREEEAQKPLVYAFRRAS